MGINTIGLDAHGPFWETPAPIMISSPADSAMFPSKPTRTRTIVRWLGPAVLSASLIVPGCQTVDLRGPSYPESELTSWVGQYRSGGQPTGASHAFSNRARQIDQSCGGSR